MREWVDDLQIAGRQVGWVTTRASEYIRPLGRIAVRWKLKNGQWEYAGVLSTLLPQEVVAETGQPPETIFDQTGVLLAYVRFYDERGGAVETSFKDDKQGLGLTKRSKKRFAAQQMLRFAVHRSSGFGLQDHATTNLCSLFAPLKSVIY